MDKDKIEMKTLMATAEVADYLAALAEGFKTGCIVVEKDGERLVLSPAATGQAEVEVEARLKKDKAKFSLELSWRLAETQEEGAQLTISTGLPPAASPEDRKAEDKKPEDKKADARKSEEQKPAPQAAAAPVGVPASASAKSDVKPAAPAVNEPGGKAAPAAAAQAKPKQ